MKYSQFKADQARYFGALAPEEMLGRLSMTGYFGIAAIAEREDLEAVNDTIKARKNAMDDLPEDVSPLDTSKDVGVGLIIASYAGPKELSIEWLYVEDAFRGSEVGATLVYEVCMMAKERNMEWVSAKIIQNIPDPVTQGLMSEYLSLLGFRWQTGMSGEYDIKAGELSRESFVKKARATFKKAPGYGPLQELTDLDWKKMMNSLPPKDRDRLLLYTSREKNRYDSQLSRVKLLKAGIPEGFFLIQKVGHVFYPVGIWTRTGSQKDKLMLIFSAAAQMDDLLEDSDRIRIISRGEDVVSYITALGLHLPMLPAFALKVAPQDYVSSFGEGRVFESGENLFFPSTPDNGYKFVAVEKYTDL